MGFFLVKVYVWVVMQIHNAILVSILREGFVPARRAFSHDKGVRVSQNVRGRLI